MPPPGHAPPGYAPPGYAPPGYPPPGYPVAMPAAHKPGAIPLRPLGLGDIYDGAFKIIRFNPKSTVGSAALVAAVAMAIPILVTGFMVLLFDISDGLAALESEEADLSGSDVAGLMTAYGALGAGAVLQWFGLLFVTGMVAHVTAAAAIGRKLSLGEAWAATHGKRWRLVGLAVLLGAATALFLAAIVISIVVMFVVLPGWVAVLASLGAGLLGFLAMVFLWVRVYYLAVPPLMLEPIGVFGALGRSWALTSRQFWRTFGIALLTLVITQIAASLIGIPFAIIGSFGPLATGNGELGLMIMIVANALSAVVSASFVAPFTSAVTSLQYIDQRIRKEGYDVELVTRAGIVAP